MTDKATSDLWWKNAVIYCADVATWLDSDGDGTGDLAGMTRRLDYLWGLGINTLWLMPFYPSPLGDDGYDITDYYAVDPRLGTLGDFVEMIRTADNLGIRVLVDLVMSHTSNQHPWFLRARRDRGSRYRHFYRWSDTKQAEPREVAQCYQAGANSCIRKPVEFREFAETVRETGRYWLALNRAAQGGVPIA